jgi:hypothetical protein
MTRQTSIDCYHQIKAEGLLSDMRFSVYQALYNLNKPSTRREVYATMNVSNQESTRFTELRNLGVIYEKTTRKCSISGRTSIEWDLTDNIPDKSLLKKNTKPNNLKKCIKFILNNMAEKGLMWINPSEIKSLLD